jgi:2-polyprenyl-6-methoxyphenol hydroxylase-like FAD-dependent oxidoreductase
MKAVAGLAMTQLGDHAVVLGASMGGLLAGRVLADFYRTVTIVERDVLPDGPVNRRGVPQGRHAHGLLARGSQILDELFPGLLNELVAGGAPVLDGTDMSVVYMSFSGHLFPQKCRPKDPTPVFLPSRPLLEHTVRQRVRHISNITLLEAHDVGDLTSSRQRNRVTGALVCGRDDGVERVLPADLIVDATGRGSRTPTFLDHLGYTRPAQERTNVRLTYSSQLLRLPPGALRERVVIIGPIPARPTGMALFGNENSTWNLTAVAMAGRQTPTKLTEMLAFVEDFAPPHVTAVLRDAEALTEVACHQIPCSHWRRYDKMQSFPAGLLVFGDAICSFDPVYGQGMTVAALQAKALHECLQHGTTRLARRYFRATAKPISAAWQLAGGGDLNLPDVEGPRPLSARIANRYIDRLQRTAESDTVVAEQLLRVTGLIDPPSRLLHPEILFRVASTSWRWRSHHRRPPLCSTTTNS